MDTPPKSIIDISIQNPIKAPPNFTPNFPESSKIKWKRIKKNELFK
jgi:hypothetical protein